MPQNVEIKALVEDLPALMKIAKLFSKESPAVVRQHDIFYHCQKGRLKLRTTTTEDDQRRYSELIFYRRDDHSGPKTSDCEIAQVTDPDGMDRVLSASVGRKGTVTKKRILFMIGQTRLHIDEVEGLGNYMELEVVLKDEQTPEDGAIIADDLMGKLGIEPADLVTGAYFDLLMNNEQVNPH